MANDVTHIAHRHPLVLTTQPNCFTCDGCKFSGSGLRYRCNSCDFDLHRFCAQCPERISFFGHPHHQLVLTPEEVWKTVYSGVCDICHEPMRGMMYRCDKCYFDLHLHCSLLPLIVKGAPAHPEHELALVPISPRVCKVCSGNTVVWTYRCAPCHIYIHPQCVGETQANARGQSSGAGVRGERPVAQHGGQSGTNTTAKVAKFVLKFGLGVAREILGIPSSAEVVADALMNVFDQ